MFGARFPRVSGVALLLALIASAAGVGASAELASAATSPHRAAVIVDTGGTVHKVVITFTEDSISGLDALQRAGANPVVYSMGPGGAVCRIFGVGRDAGPNCLGGQDGDNRYWAYFRAPAGTSTFKYSSIGAGLGRVHDGDVEGWKFGTGTAPAYVSLASLTTPPPPPPSTTPATKPATVVPPGGSTPGAAPGPAGGTATPGATSPPTLPATGSIAAATATPGTAAASNAAGGGAKESTKAKARATGDGETVNTALTSAKGGSGGGSAWSLLLFAVLIAAIAAAIVLVRRVRKQHLAA
jgi:hypothetical protein